jgi:hypothetical protein
VYEPQVPETVTAEIVPTEAPSLAETALTAYRAGITEARPVTVLYAPVTITHHNNYPAPAPAVADARVRILPGPPQHPAPAPAALPRRRFTRAELCFYLGTTITGSSGVAVALSILAGDPSLLLAAPAALGGAVILGSAAAINREESGR